MTPSLFDLALDFAPAALGAAVVLLGRRARAPRPAAAPTPAPPAAPATAAEVEPDQPPAMDYLQWAPLPPPKLMPPPIAFVTVQHNARFVDQALNVTGWRATQCVFDGCILTLDRFNAHFEGCQFIDCRFQGPWPPHVLRLSC